MWAFAKLDIGAFAIASAVASGAVLFVLTAVLVLKGAAPGEPVGPHLAELATIFPGYTVTLPGAAIGALYAGVLGAIVGFVVAAVWNFAHGVFLAVIRMRASLATYEID